MKATGIVRRIDDLGRVVIPKEIRRTLRIREGDPLEIYTDKEGEVIFKKYSPIGELSAFSTMFAETISKNCMLGVIITDKDNIIATAGVQKKDLYEKRISMDIEKLMESRQVYIYRAGEAKKMSVCEATEKYNASVVVPIITEGDIIGSIALIMPDNGAVSSDSDVKLVQTSAQLLGKQLET